MSPTCASEDGKARITRLMQQRQHAVSRACVKPPGAPPPVATQAAAAGGGVVRATRYGGVDMTISAML